MTNPHARIVTEYRPTNDPRAHPNQRDGRLRLASLGGNLLMQIGPARSLTVPHDDIPELILQMAVRAGLDIQDLVNYLTAPATDATDPVGTFDHVVDDRFTALSEYNINTATDELDAGAPYATVTVEVAMPPGTLYPAAGRFSRAVETIHCDRIAGREDVLSATLRHMVDNAYSAVTRTSPPAWEDQR